MAQIPQEAQIYAESEGAYFKDCYSAEMQINDMSALDYFLLTAELMPAWFNGLMSLRNRIVSKLGLKDLGQLGDTAPNKLAEDYEIGDRVGIFSLYANSQDEVILEDRDSHLNVRVSIFLKRHVDKCQSNKAEVYTSTVVHVNNSFGKVYMFFVTPVHKLIVPMMLKKLAKQFSI
ncbi:DUF2867 domain-containing protein [Marinomonas sp.]|nr:DUF2867 domain-containing protein [Marinomonas sp.]MDB4837930.1 DUF2867 domain-containing protein [Marinomonas sp.]